MTRAQPSSAYTSDFVSEFEAETGRLLRSRFQYFCGLGAGIGLLLMVGLIVVRFLGDFGAEQGTSSFVRFFARLLFSLVPATLFGFGFVLAWRRRVPDRDLLRLTTTLVIAVGLFHIVGAHIPGVSAIGMPLAIFTFVLACIFLPWDAKHAVKVGLIVLAIYLSALFFFAFAWPAPAPEQSDERPSPVQFGAGNQPVPSAQVGVPSPAAAPGSLAEADPDQSSEDAPNATVQSRLFIIFAKSAAASIGLLCGVGIAWGKHSRRVERYRTSFLQRRYTDIRRELTDARRIHEDLFPKATITGPIQFNYIYEPMRQIGGDYLYAKHGTSSAGGHRLSLVIMDVTGHGIPAALTVNRLHGELERLFAEHPNLNPGNVLKLLNRYVHLTLATHSVYVTAICIRVDLLRNELEYASGGHPPAFLRSVDGTIRELPSTAFVLGACADEDFQPDPAVHHFGPGDGVIAYTDGALEARDRTGRMLGTQGLLKVIASLSQRSSPVTSDWAGHILRAVESFRYGPPADDTLVVQVARTMESIPPPSARGMKTASGMDLSRSRIDIEPLMPEREDAL